MKRTFASLDPQEALHLAIAIEERNESIYRHSAEMFDEFGDKESLEIASVFWEMSAEEKNHASLLRGKYEDRYGTSSCALTEEDISEFIEAPRLENGDFFAISLSRSEARNRVLRVALNAESAAHHFYSSLAESSQAGPARQLYVELANLEENHVKYLEQKLTAQVLAS